MKLTCGNCEIEMGTGILGKQGDYVRTLGSTFVVITDDRVGPIYGRRVADGLGKEGLEVHYIPFLGGEQNKTRATKEAIENQMLEKGLGRDCAVIAVGGGVVTDLAGFVAATYCRGVPLVMVPTSLLGMVDASIGGKVGVNVPYGKNMIGSIYPPRKVVIDLATLKTLPKKELANGAVEMIKHGLIADKALFERMERDANSSLSLEMIFESVRIKKEIVEEDETEKGKRRLLNFGHTVGHALEKVFGYTLSHGEAVAIGMLTEGYLAQELGVLEMGVVDRIKTILMQYGLPLRLPQPISPQEMIVAMAHDKKTLRREPRFVLLKGIGTPLPCEGAYCQFVEPALLNRTLEWMNALCSH